MNYNPYTGPHSYNRREPRTLSPIGSVMYSVIATVLLLLCAVCLRTDGENALMCMLVPVFTVGAAYLLTSLLVHGRMILFACSAVSSVICAYILCHDIPRSLLCLGAFAAAGCVYLATRKKYFTHSGIICLCSGVYALLFCVMLCVLCIQKYGGVSFEIFSHAYDSFKSILLSTPNEYLAQLEQGLASGAVGVSAEDIEYYRSLVSMLEGLLEVAVYTVPSMLLCVCAIGGFITVRGARSGRRMLGLSDTVGVFEISAVSSIIFIVLNLLSLFVDAYTPIGIAVYTVCSPLQLGLAYQGLVFLLGWIRLNGKGPMYYVGIAILGVTMTGMCISILAYVGAYRSIYLARKRKAASGTCNGGNGEGNNE